MARAPEWQLILGMADEEGGLSDLISILCLCLCLICVGDDDVIFFFRGWKENEKTSCDVVVTLAFLMNDFLY